ncbi:type IX secretion system outer membrane channel protein PorV [Gelidibacter salicanalis]|uniref:Type IX secretion system outer membrane channel protein PorV n=1 Tax=Gelidibacter salicanalis TaxID=291193 RepID=A0A5C7AHB3_9FLAO|nr:type IX secretion system outer membrane channel protein PorV [Gelidibacter salicanalis]TXE07299.1 type IX secretion system outer membrane channel protein PorV [Gelidibacter salicanalis]
MKKIVLSLITLSVFNFASAQETVIFENQSSVITTAVPFLLIAADARAAGMGDIGVATSVDAFSQQWNQSKYAFSESKSGIGVSYTPYLSKLVNDIFLGNVTYFNRINERSAFAVSFKYFSLGEIELVQDEFSEALIAKPNEMTIDASYALRLSNKYSMAVGLRYLRSDLKIQALDNSANPGSSVAVDISGYYQGEEEAYGDFNGRTRLGFSIQNLGPKIKYDDGGRDNFLPTNLRLGGGFDFIFDQYNTLALTAEVTKLLVPTPPLYGYDETNGEPGQQVDQEPTYIVKGKSQDVGFLSGVFQSFGDAPNGFSEEMKEFTWALGAEYKYQDSFAFRTGYFNESDDKGARKFFALGAGFKYTTINIDMSYLFSTSKVQSPLENTLRFSLTFNFGDGAYKEY